MTSLNQDPAAEQPECTADPPCSVLLDPTADLLPDHVCPHTAWKSTAQYARQLTGVVQVDGGLVDPAAVPPMVRQELAARWGWSSAWPVLCRGRGRDAIAEALRVHPGQLPVVDLPFDSLGLVVERRVSKGRTRLFASVQYILPARPPGPVSSVALPLFYLLPPVPSPDGSICPPTAPSYNPERWRYGEAQTAIDVAGRPSKDTVRLATQLDKWYRKTLLGKRVSAAGPGRTRLEHEDWTGWRDAVELGIAIKNKNPKLTWPIISLSHLGVPESTHKRWRATYRRLGLKPVE